MYIYIYNIYYVVYSKEDLEKEIGQIEADLKKLDSKHVIIDYTK